MNEKFDKNTKVENFTNMLGIAVRLIIIDHLIYILWNIVVSDYTVFAVST